MPEFGLHAGSEYTLIYAELEEGEQKFSLHDLTSCPLDIKFQDAHAVEQVLVKFNGPDTGLPEQVVSGAHTVSVTTLTN